MSETTERTIDERAVTVTVGAVTLDGDLRLPDGARAVVLMAAAVAAIAHAIAMWPRASTRPD
jgi:hypothetical protein